jgi:hypothetical protein
MRRFVLSLIVAAVATACAKEDPKPVAATTGRATGAAMTGWEQRNYALGVVPAEQLAPLSLEELQRVRAIIFGMHGRVFQDSTLQHWLASRPWYRPDTSFTNGRLTANERATLDLVREAEAAKHTQIETGDMRFYQNRVITSAMLGKHSPQDWEVLEAEVLANHGYIFDRNGDATYENRELDPSSLQGYFSERYWYREDPDFDATGLTAIEQQNLDTITLAATRQSGRAVSPGMMNLFQATALTDTMLAQVSIADLRLLRNEIYARHGRPFKTKWIADAFRRYAWYTVRGDYSDAELSAVERANIALITSREERLHAALSTDTLDVPDVIGLRPDDARKLRNEIFARHGRRFRDPELQGYFASLAWYKPNDAFREDQLNPTERANAELISQYEHGDFTEG